MVSGSVGEEKAVETMKAGASDYILKDNLARLVPVLQRELREAEANKEKKLIEANLEEERRGFASGAKARVHRATCGRHRP